jgi:glutamate dehydrogenase/leucine dehydrogenase
LMKAIREVESMSSDRKLTWRESAMMIGVKRVAEAHKLRGLYP